MGSLLRRFPTVFLVALSACANPAFDRPLLVVDLTRAPVPVMMSRVKHEPRPGSAPLDMNDRAFLSGASTESTPTGEADDAIYTFEEGRTTVRSRRGASEQFVGGIPAGTGWVAVGAVVFSASDSTQLASGEMRRELSLQATGRP